MLSSKASKVQIQQEPHDALKAGMKLHMAHECAQLIKRDISYL